MDRFTTEMSQIICELVEIEDIQSLRLVSKFSKKLATPFLLSEVQLVFHPDSFQRLLAISRHPKISKQVKILYYEPKKDLAELASVISESHRFSLQLSTGHDEQTDMLGLELRPCRRYLKYGRVRDLIT
jgi:hypothetical protein